MKSQSQLNRVDADLHQWGSRERLYNNLFSQKTLLRVKLQFYDQISAKYKNTGNPDEKISLKALHLERRLLEKQLYPNVLKRLLRRWLIAPVRKQIAAKSDNKRAEYNSQTLYLKVQRAGFSGLSSKIEENIRQDQQQFSIPVSYYINEKERLDHQLLFAKDQSGAFHFEGYKTTLYNETRPNEQRQHFFSAANSYNLNTSEVYNLLSGRSVQKGSSWLQFDFNDKDSQGNYRIKDFYDGYGYNLEKVLQELPLKQLLNRTETERMMNALKGGERFSVSFVKNGNEQRFYIEANPQSKTVNIYDEHSRKITLNTALGNKTFEAVKITQKINNKQEQSQAKKNGMQIS